MRYYRENPMPKNSADFEEIEYDFNYYLGGAKAILHVVFEAAKANKAEDYRIYFSQFAEFLKHMNANAKEISKIHHSLGL